MTTPARRRLPALPEAAVLGLGCVVATLGWHVVLPDANAVETNGLLLSGAAAGALAMKPAVRSVRVVTGATAVLCGVFGLLLCALAALTLLVGSETPDDHDTGLRLLCTGMATTVAATTLGWLIPRTHD